MPRPRARDAADENDVRSYDASAPPSVKPGDGGASPPSDVTYSESRENGTWIDSSAIVDLVGTTLDVVTDCLGSCCCCAREWSCDEDDVGEGGRRGATVDRLLCDPWRAWDAAVEGYEEGWSLTTCSGGPRIDATDETEPLTT